MKKFIIIIILLLGISLSVFGEEGVYYEIDLALQNPNNYQEEYRSLKHAENELKFVYIQMFPSISMDINNSSDLGDLYGDLNYSINLNQTIYNGHRKKNSLEIAKNKVEIAKLKYTYRKQEIINTVVNYKIELYRNKNQLDHINNIISWLNSIAENDKYSKLIKLKAKRQLLLQLQEKTNLEAEKKQIENNLSILINSQYYDSNLDSFISYLSSLIKEKYLIGDIEKQLSEMNLEYYNLQDINENILSNMTDSPVHIFLGANKSSNEAAVSLNIKKEFNIGKFLNMDYSLSIDEDLKRKDNLNLNIRYSMETIDENKLENESNVDKFIKQYIDRKKSILEQINQLEFARNVISVDIQILEEELIYDQNDFEKHLELKIKQSNLKIIEINIFRNKLLFSESVFLDYNKNKTN